MKGIYTLLFTVYVFLGATALVAEEAAQPAVEAAAAKPDAAKAQQALAATETDPEDEVEVLGWPREYDHEEGQVVLYQPQLDAWSDFTTLTGKAAVSVQFKGSDEFLYGAIYIKAATEVAKEEDQVLLDDFTITKTHFPDIDDATAAKAGDLVTRAISVQESMIMSLERLVADLEADNHAVREATVNLDPPPIYYSDQPAILLMFMGEPSFKPVAGVDGLMFAVNTNWDLLLDLPTSTYYLLNGESWLETADPVKGPWKQAEKLPDTFNKLPDDDDWGDVREHIPGKPAAEQGLVYVATEPSELIQTDGAPEFGLVSGTKLMYVSNTDSDIFFDNETKQFYFLTAGRWFRAENLQGPWEAASADLPEEFAKIPEDHKKSDVLSAVPGTPDAEAAVLLASVPQKATVSREGTTTEVFYEGEPQFVEIKGTSPVVSYAINSPNDVFLVSGLYYALVDGVWFVASMPTGVWAVAVNVDEAIYTIPEDCPKYNATYVRVYDSTPDTVVVGYTSGYSGSYVAATGVLMFGLGLWAGSYWGSYPYFSHYHYHPHFYGYGCGMRYRYGRGYYMGGIPRLYGPYGGIGGRAGYNPVTGRFYRGGVARGPYGSAFARTSYNPFTNRRVTRAGVRTPYGSWGRTVSRRGDDWVRAGHRSVGGRTIAGARGSGGRAVVGGYNRRTGDGFRVSKGKNNLFVGNDGGVYRHDGKNWSRSAGKGGWKQTDMKLDAKDRKAIQERKRTAGVKERKGGATALKDRKGAAGVKERKGGAAALKDRKGGAGVRDRKAGAGSLKDKKGKTAAKQPLKQKSKAAAKARPKAAKAKPAARKATKKAAPKKKAPARKTSSKKYASGKHKKSSGSVKSNLNRSHKTRSSGSRRAKSSSRNRSSAKRSGGGHRGGGGRSRGGGGRRR
ncbi:MAG: hypothetical protein ABFR19_06370 [Pseudomonadota bacterium]